MRVRLLLITGRSGKMFAASGYAIASSSSSQFVPLLSEEVCVLCNDPFVLNKHTPDTLPLLNADPRELHLFRNTRCGHRFHLKCMNRHFPVTKRCPVCHTSVKWKDIANKCVHCLDPLDANEGVFQASCCHKFHYECITQLLQIKERCPICRRKITSFKTSCNSDAAIVPQAQYFDSHSGNAYEIDLEQLSLRDDDDYSVDHNEFADEFYSDCDYNSCDDESYEEDNFETVCTFCDRRFSDTDEKTKRIRCGHKLHILCMDRYLPTAKKCPVCRMPVKWKAISNKCVVCLDPLSNAEESKRLPCDHQCHSSCLKQWLLSKKKCPICRRKIHVTNECVICLEDIRPADVLMKLACLHEFHDTCVNSWLLREETCPLCRKIVPQN